MAISTFGWRLRVLRQTTAAATVAIMVPLMAGCVSAVDDSSAFGFNNAQQAAAEEAAGATPAAGAAEGQPAEADGETVASAGEKPAAETAPETEGSTDTGKTGRLTAADAEETKAEPRSLLESAGKPIIASGRTTIAAYAGGTIDAAEPETGGKKIRQADSTLFASLFTQSKAKTPIRNAESGKSRRVILHAEGSPEPVDHGGPALPGVKSTASLFEIGQKASADYDAEILEEATGGEDGSYEVASLGGMARLAPNGLRVQRPDVETSCFEPKLVSMIRAVEARFNTKVVVTSGYRSPAHNLRVNGAKRSMHMACKAADIQIPGANKFEVANYVRSLPGRGGVGTYCHTTAIHIDIGTQRDWNWACRRRQT